MATGIILLAIQDEKGVYRLMGNEKFPPGIYFPFDRKEAIEPVLLKHIGLYIDMTISFDSVAIHREFCEEMTLDDGTSVFAYLVWLKSKFGDISLRSRTIPDILRRVKKRDQRLTYLKALQALAHLDSTPITVEC